MSFPHEQEKTLSFMNLWKKWRTLLTQWWWTLRSQGLPLFPLLSLALMLAILDHHAPMSARLPGWFLILVAEGFREGALCIAPLAKRAIWTEQYQWAYPTFWALILLWILVMLTLMVWFLFFFGGYHF